MNKHGIVVLVSVSAVILVIGLGIVAFICMEETKIDPSLNELLIDGISLI